MKVRFAVTSVARLDTIPKISGQVIVTLDKIGYYYDFDGNRYKVNDGGSYVTFESELTVGTKIGSIEIDGQSTDIFAPTMPEDLGDLINDLGFITRTSDNLVNYYTKSSTYTKSEINDQIASLGNIDIAVVDELPTTNISTRTIYLVPREHTPSHSSRDEYMNTDGTTSGWELIGTADIDVSELATRTEVNSVLAGYAQTSSIPSKTSELANDSNYTSDSNYVHTDSNFTNSNKQKLNQLSSVSVVSESQEGDAIATITCNGVDTTLYASIGMLPRVTVETRAGSKVTASKLGIDIEFTESSSGIYKGSLNDYGVWGITSLYKGTSVSDNVDVDAVKSYWLSLPQQYKGTLVEKTWNIDRIRGDYIWNYRGNTYYTNTSDRQYMLNKETNDWEPTSWTIPLGIRIGAGDCMWSDGEHAYYSSQTGEYQYIFNETTNDWDIMTWKNNVQVSGQNVWTDGMDFYFSLSSSQYVLDKATNAWSPVTWGSSLTPAQGSCVWSDGENTYYSITSAQYVLNKATRTWETKTWNISNINGQSIFVHDNTIYYITNGDSYTLNKSTGEWETMIWNVNDSVFLGSYFWTDGEYVYCNSRATSLGWLSYIWTDPE